MSESNDLVMFSWVGNEIGYPLPMRSLGEVQGKSRPKTNLVPVLLNLYLWQLCCWFWSVKLKKKKF